MRRSAIRLSFLIGIMLCAGFLATRGRALASPTAASPAPARVFDVTVSLEWQPGTKDNLAADLRAGSCPASASNLSYTSDLIAGLKSASAYLYGFSDGRMALGKVTIYTGAQHWYDADIRVLADNGFRPSAYPGGIVKAPRPYANPTLGQRPTFYPAPIYLSRLWSGQGARCGQWSVLPGVRTLGHEWAHYALYLWDEYIDQGTQTESYCTNAAGAATGLGILDPASPATTYSVMGYQYRAEKLWLPSVAAVGPCTKTPQMAVHGVSDWETLRRFYPEVTLPPGLRPGPTFAGSPAEALFSATVINAPSAPLQASASARVAALPTPKLIGDTYLVRPVPNSDGRPQQIMRQGEMILGERPTFSFWGVQATSNDRAAVIVQDWATAKRYAYPKDYRAVNPTLKPGALNTITVTQTIWRPDLLINPIMEITRKNQQQDEVVGLQVKLRDCSARPAKVVHISYCPAGGTCSSPRAVLPSAGVFTTSFIAPNDGKGEPPALHGYVYVRKPETGEETIGWYQLAGGVGPAYADGHTPLLDSLVSVDLPLGGAPPSNQDTQVLFGGAQLCSLQGALPPGIRGIMGTPFQVNIGISGRGTKLWGMVASDPLLRVRLGYNQDLVSRLQIDERNLKLLRYVRSATAAPHWAPVQFSGRSLSLNWISSVPVAMSGQGDIFALGY